MDHLGEPIHIVAITDRLVTDIEYRSWFGAFQCGDITGSCIFHVHQRDKILSVARDHFLPGTQPIQQSILPGSLSHEEAAFQDAPTYWLWLALKQVHHRLHDRHRVRD